MRKLLPLLLLLLLFTACAHVGSPSPLVRQIEAIAKAHPGTTIAVAYHDLRTGETLERNQREVFHAASTMKVPVMLGIFEAVTRGELRLEQPVRVKNDFVSIFDGSRYSLEAREDSDKQLYELVGQDVTLEELVRRMIVRSSNLATNLVIELIGAPRVMALMQEIGAHDLRVLRGVEDDKAYHAGMNNTVTAHDLMLVFKTLGEQRAISPAASAKMNEILLAQEHNDGIPAGLPPGTPVAHKTGSITKISHDAGIIDSRYVLVVLTRGFADGDVADRVIGEISRAVWEWRR